MKNAGTPNQTGTAVAKAITDPASRKSKWANTWDKIRTRGALYTMVAPGVILIFLFNYVPMYGILIAFQNYSPAKGILGSKWVGLKHFAHFINSPYFARLFGNTFALGFCVLLFSFPAPIIFALLLNEMKDGKFKKVTQTISYIPYFISTVVVVGLMKILLSTNGGVINDLRVLIGMAPKDFFADPNWFRPLYIISGLWTGVGYGSIMYLAAISGINPELYESAVLDGATRFQQCIYVTIPCISNIIVIQLIFAVGALVSNDYEKILLMQSPLNLKTSDMFSTYVYREGVLGGSYSYTTAVNLLTSFVSLFFILTTNFIAKKLGEETLF